MGRSSRERGSPHHHDGTGCRRRPYSPWGWTCWLLAYRRAGKGGDPGWGVVFVHLPASRRGAPRDPHTLSCAPTHPIDERVLYQPLSYRPSTRRCEASDRLPLHANAQPWPSHLRTIGGLLAAGVAPSAGAPPELRLALPCLHTCRASLSEPPPARPALRLEEVYLVYTAEKNRGLALRLHLLLILAWVVATLKTVSQAADAYAQYALRGGGWGRARQGRVV